jgi:hypothetical protein
MATTIKPIQKSMLKIFDNLFGYYGYDSDLHIMPNNVSGIEKDMVATKTNGQ